MKIAIKMTSRVISDTKMFRAYQVLAGDRMKPAGVSCSTTGNEVYAIIRCAAKAYVKLQEPQSDPDEVETRITVREQLGTTPRIWLAKLQPKGAK